MSSYPDDNMPPQSNSGYQLDFDNLDAINPFQGSNKMVLSPVTPAVKSPLTYNPEPQPESALEEPNKIDPTLDGTLPFIPSLENSLADFSNTSSTESSVVTVTVPSVPALEEQGSYSATPDEKQPTNVSDSTDQGQTSGSFVEEATLSAKTCYNLDSNQLDGIKLFQTGGCNIQNSPSNADPPAEESRPMDAEVVEELPVQDVKPMTTVAPEHEGTASPPVDEPEPAEAPVQAASVKLEFTFGDGGDVKPKPPPKRFGKRPSTLKPEGEKSASELKASKEAPVKPTAAAAGDIPLPKGSYYLHSEKFEDPYFNPFGTKTNIANSPTCSNKPGPVLEETDRPEQTDKPEEKEAGAPDG